MPTFVGALGIHKLETNGHDLKRVRAFAFLSGNDARYRTSFSVSKKEGITR